VLSLPTAWEAPGPLEFAGTGTTAVVFTSTTGHQFAGTAVRWARLAGQGLGVENTTEFSLDETAASQWVLPAGRYTVTMHCDGPCSVSFPTRPAGLASSLTLRTRAAHVLAWSAAIRTAGVPGGTVTHDFPGDLHGILLATVAASASFRIANFQAAQVCRTTDVPVCRRQQDGEEQERTFETSGAGSADQTTFRLTRLYLDENGGNSSVHTIAMTQIVDAQAAVLYFPT
jgi:hypothetical protein